MCVWCVYWYTYGVFIYDFHASFFTSPLLHWHTIMFPSSQNDGNNIHVYNIYDHKKKKRASNRMLTAGLCGFRRRLDGTFFFFPLPSRRSYRCPWITMKMRKFRRVQQPLNWLNTTRVYLLINYYFAFILPFYQNFIHYSSINFFFFFSWTISVHARSCPVHFHSLTLSFLYYAVLSRAIRVSPTLTYSYPDSIVSFL